MSTIKMKLNLFLSHVDIFGTYSVLSKVGTETGTEFFLKEKLSWQEKWGKQA